MPTHSIGSLGAVIDDAFSAFLKVEKEIDEISGGRRIDSRMRLSRIRGLASMLYVLQCSLLGAVHIPSSESQTSLHAARLARLSANNQKSRVCALCAVTGDRLSRCGGCKAVYYCSPSHQKAHWIDHKVSSDCLCACVCLCMCMRCVSSNLSRTVG